MKEAIRILLEQLNNEYYGQLVQKNIEAYVDKLVGHATIIDVTEEHILKAFISYYHNDPKGNTAFLSMLAVASPFRNLGIGQLLLDKSINHLRSLGFKIYELEVLKSNQSAMAFYIRNGFKIIESTQQKFKMTKTL